MSVKILEDLCDCKLTVSENLLQLGMEAEDADMLSKIIQNEVEGFEPVEGAEKVRESHILKRILQRKPLDEEMAAKVCQVTRNAYREYWHRKKMLQKHINFKAETPWEVAAEHTLELYKKTKPSFSELTRATLKIQTAYRGYYVRRNLLRHLTLQKPKPKGPKLEMPGPPVDVAGSREIDLGPVVQVKIKDDDVKTMFEEHASKVLGLNYDPMKTLTHVDDDLYLEERKKIIHVLKDDSLTPDKSATPRSTKSLHTSRISTPEIEHSGMMTRTMRHPSVAIVDLPIKMGNFSRPYDPNIAKVSFAQIPPEVIPLDDDAEIPEELPDNRTEGDGSSGPIDSVSSAATSVPDEDDATDVEDITGDIMD